MYVKVMAKKKKRRKVVCCFYGKVTKPHFFFYYFSINLFSSKYNFYMLGNGLSMWT